jgi:hypothetical protein
VQAAQQGGFVAVLATEPARSAEFYAQLRELVRKSSGGVLVCLRRPALWTGGPIVGVHLRPAEPDRPADPAEPGGRPRGAAHALGPGLWLGPLSRSEDRRALCRWLRDGGPAGGPPPVSLRQRALPGPNRPLMASQSLN